MPDATKPALILFPQWDLDSFDGLLQRHVQNGRVDYSGFDDDETFITFLEQIARMDRQSLDTRKKKLVFYMNSYNALTIQAVAGGWSPSTLLGRIRFFLFSRHDIAGERLSLLGIERGRLIPLGEPRIHFPIVCASASCPLLRSHVFRLQGLEEQLESATSQFINDPEKNSFDTTTGIATLSRIFKWYRREFERAAGSLEFFLATYADGPTGERLRAGGYRIRFHPYDWSLNGNR